MKRNASPDAPGGRGRALRPTAAALILLALAASACTIGLPAVGAGGLGAGSVEPELLRAQQDKRALRRFVGTPPVSCFPNSANERVCTWQIPTDHPRAETFASLSGPLGPWWLLCALPSDGSPRAAASCTLKSRAHSKAALMRRARAGRRVSNQKARMRLDAAPDLLALSRLVGHGPDDCQSDSLERWVCRWSSRPASPGYETTLALLGAFPGSDIHMACELPVAGGTRDKDSCRLRIAD